MTMLGRTALGFWAGAALIVLSNAQNVLLQNLPWGPGVWASERSKVVLVPAGVTIGSLLPASAAMEYSNDWGGSLTIIVSGNIEGAGGAINGGTGGTALKARINADAVTKARLILNPGSLTAGGGGGGGKGGNGGAGTYNVTVSEGPHYEFNTYRYQYSTAWSGLTKVIWAGSVLYDAWDGGRTSITLGGVTYSIGSHQAGENYSIRRQYPVATPSVGGVGGDGGRGRGYAQSLTAGSAGTAGVNNSGAGGAGGSGAERGSSGANGSNGVAGNAGAGAAGAAGGLAGWGIEDPTNIIVTGTGTIITRT